MQGLIFLWRRLSVIAHYRINHIALRHNLSWGNIDFSRKGKAVCSVGLRPRLPPALVIPNKMSLKSGIYARLRIVRRTKTRPCTVKCKVLFFYVGVNADCLSEKNLYYPTTWYPWPCNLIIADDRLNCKPKLWKRMSLIRSDILFSWYPGTAHAI